MSRTLEPSRSPRGQYTELTWEPVASGSRKAERTPRRYRAWTPDTIADFEPSLRSSTASLCERAGFEVRQLSSNPAALIPLEGLGRQLLRSESLASSQIEGLAISHRKLAAAEFGNLANYKAREIVGTVQAMERALEIGAAPGRLTVESIQAIHREIAVVPPARPDRRADPRGAELDRRHRPERRRIRGTAGRGGARPARRPLPIHGP